MSKPGVIAVASCRIVAGAVCAGFLSLTLAYPVQAVAASSEPPLRRSEQLDIRRLGKVSDDERSLLRAERHAAASGAEETRTVQDMLDSLRRMQATTAEITRLIRDIPAPSRAAEAVAAEPPEPALSNRTLALIGCAVVGLLAIWWSRRRERESVSDAGKASPAPAEMPPSPVIAAANRLVPPEPAAPPPAPVAAAAAVERAKPPAHAEPSVPADVADTAVIDFSLEEADPESIARANSELEKLQTKRIVSPPPRPPESKVDPTLELAEIMLSLGLDQGAAETLVEYIDANPRQALHHSLKLLDIYRNSGHRRDFKEAAEKLRQNFNIQAEDWMRESTAEAPTLEGFSRLSKHIQEIWSRPAECISYLQNLLEDNREGSRAGFPWPVAEEILLLIEILKETSGTTQRVGTQRSTT